MTVPRSLRAARTLARYAAWALAVLLVLAGLTALALESAWGKERLRRLIVSQADRILTGTLEVDRLSGSLLRGVRLEGVRLVQDGVPVVTIADATVSYRLRELYQGGTAIRHLDLRGLRVVGAKRADGRWNLASLVRSRPPSPPGQKPGRLIAIEAIVLHDAQVELRDPLTFGPVRVPSRFEAVNGTVALDLQSPAWKLAFTDLTWRGLEPDLTVDRLNGGLATGPDGWRFDRLRVATPRSAFTVDGGVYAETPTSRLGLRVDAERFAFQEWSGLLPGMRNIAVESAFGLDLRGTPDRLATTIDLRSNGGTIRSALSLNTTVPGWHGLGTADVSRLNVSRWFNRPDRPSDITGHVTFDLDLDLGRRFPRGRYAFRGAHAAYLGYEADDVRARGTLTAEEAVLESVTATAYGANVRVDAGAIGIDAPYLYRFTGRADGVDLRRVPRDVPVPHVESALLLDYDVRGQFTTGVLVGTATFGPSEFLGARIGDSAVGAIDTSVTPFTYSGRGGLSALSLRRFGEGLDVAWMREPRYDGTVDGQFHVEGSGADAATMRLTGGGRLARAELFDGTLMDADVAIDIAAGSLRGSYNGRFAGVNPARAIDDLRFTASLTGSGQAGIVVTDLLTREVTLADYAIDGSVTLARSTLRGVDIQRAFGDARLADQTLTVARLELSGPSGEATGHGTIELDDVRSSSFDYDVRRADLARVAGSQAAPLSGVLTTAGRLTGRLTRPRMTGTARVTQVSAGRVSIDAGAVDYDVTVPTDDPYQAVATLSGRAGPVAIAGQTFPESTFSASYDRLAATLDLRGTRTGGVNGSLKAVGQLDLRRRTLDLSRLDATVQALGWRLPPGTMPHISWDGSRATIQGLALTDADTGRQRLSVAGDWSSDGQGALNVTAAGVFIDTFAGALGRPARYGGRLDATAVIRAASGGSPVVTGLLTIVDGRIRRLPFERFIATVEYDDGRLNVEARLDQAPGVWLTAIGHVPLSLLDEGQPDRPMRLAVRSSAIDLGILEGVTDVVNGVSGRLTLDLAVSGSGRDPHFEGTVDVANAAFAVRATGSRYKKGRLTATLSRDRVEVSTAHVEDGNGHTLDVTGSLGTHELRVGDLAVEVRARGFEVLRNEFGRTEVDAQLNLRGQFESPRLTGRIGISEGELNVDEILDRVLLRPYATEADGAPAADTELDALQALNPWSRIGLDLAIDSRGTLRMIGSNVQVSAGTPLGLGNINVRAYGEVYLYKDPAQPLFVTGSLDSLVGTYAFQGRRFELDPTSAIVFRGDLNPELYVTVTREISGVQARVSIVGPLSEPELRLASTPQLDDSNILALIVFNTSINDLSALQQQELAVRAGTLAAGFLATPLVTALERSLGLDILEIETGEVAGGTPKVTIGDEVAPGLVARFSRQFGQQEYNEASIEYYLSRLFRIRATFSDAGSTLARSTFRRVERAGVDLLVFFSF